MFDTRPTAPSLASASATTTVATLVALALALALCSTATPLTAQHDRTVPPPAAPGVGGDAAAILQSYVDAWRGAEEMALADTLVVGFRFSGEGGGEFHATFAPDGTAELRPGVPADALVLHGDMDILRRLDRGELSAMTAVGRANMRDRTPLDFELPPEMPFTPRLQATLLPFMFHFWNRDWPEVARFGDGTTRRIHGGNAAILYYDAGLRTGFYQLEPGMHINEAADQQTNPFPSLFVMIRGAIEARLDGEARTLREGEAVLVPAGMRHEFFARSDQYGEFIIIMFGDGA